MTNNHKKNIFIVDDEPKILDVISDTLKQLDVNTTCFNKAPHCLEKLLTNKCDLLITDLKMPEMDGLELLTKVKKIIPDLPVLLITGFGNIPTAVKAIQIGAVDFIEKPLQQQSFLQKVNSLLQQSDSINNNISAVLTEREIKVLKLIVEGKSNKDIAALLHRSVRTIEVHRSRILRKLGVGNLVELIKKSAQLGLIDMPKNTRTLKDTNQNDIQQ